MQNPSEPPAVDVPSELNGTRATISGRAVSYKSYDAPMGGVTVKMLLIVRTPDGQWKAWVTVPSVDANGRFSRGDHWTLTAKVDRREFGFAKLSRPTKASAILAEPAEVPEPVEVPDPFAGFDEPQADPKAA